MPTAQLHQTATQLLKELGLRQGHHLLDFGSGNGSYSIPAAHLVGPSGFVVAVDESNESLQELNKQAKKHNLHNISTVNTKGSVQLPPAPSSIDVILAFDVLHYMEKNKRLNLYDEFNRLLRCPGTLMIHPKHTKDNHPMWHFSSITRQHLITEIQHRSFQYETQKRVTLVHDNHLEKGIILMFTKNENAK